MDDRINKPVIGLLGGVGAGKSTVAAALAELGCAVVDGDAIGHELLREEDVKREVRRRWGDGMFDAGGEVDRGALGRRVFAEASELAALNAILHPRIRTRMEARIAEARRDPAIRAVVLDAAVMLEAGWDELCTHLVFVEAPAADRAARVRASHGWDERAWRARENSQIPLDTKRKHCYAIVDNSSSASRLRQRVRQLLDRVVHLADRSR